MSWLEQEVRNSKLLEVLVCLLIVAGVTGFAIYKSRYLENVYRGPYAMPVAELVAAKSSEDLPRYWITITPTQVLDTGVDHITVRRRRDIETGRSVSGHFWLAAVGDRLMFVEAHGATLSNGQMLTGYLVDPPANVSEHLMRGVNAQWKDKVLPVMLDLGAFEAEANLGLWAGATIVLATLLWAAIALRRALKPSGHKAIRALVADGMDLAAASASIRSDIRGGNSGRLGDYRLTRDFLVKTGWAFDVRALKDLLWAYPIVISKKLYYVIPTGKSYQVALHFPDKKLTLKVSKDASEKVMPNLAALAPWALLGYAAEIDAAYSRQRSKLVELVAERRSQVLAHQEAAQGSQTATAPQQ